MNGISSSSPPKKKSRDRIKKSRAFLPRTCFQFPLVKVIVSKSAYIKLENTKNEHFFTSSHRKVARENFLGTSNESHWSKSWRDESGLSIASTPEQIRRVQATNDVNEERSNPMSRKLPLQNKRTIVGFVNHRFPQIFLNTTRFARKDPPSMLVAVLIRISPNTTSFTRKNFPHSCSFRSQKVSPRLITSLAKSFPTIDRFPRKKFPHDCSLPSQKVFPRLLASLTEVFPQLFNISPGWTFTLHPGIFHRCRGSLF